MDMVLALNSIHRRCAMTEGLKVRSNTVTCHNLKNFFSSHNNVKIIFRRFGHHGHHRGCFRQDWGQINERSFNPSRRMCPIRGYGRYLSFVRRPSDDTEYRRHRRISRNISHRRLQIERWHHRDQLHEIKSVCSWPHHCLQCRPGRCMPSIQQHQRALTSLYSLEFTAPSIPQWHSLLAPLLLTPKGIPMPLGYSRHQAHSSHLLTQVSFYKMEPNHQILSGRLVQVQLLDTPAVSKEQLLQMPLFSHRPMQLLMAALLLVLEYHSMALTQWLYLSISKLRWSYVSYREKKLQKGILCVRNNAFYTIVYCIFHVI